jgi:hypothetical protein
MGDITATVSQYVIDANVPLMQQGRPVPPNNDPAGRYLAYRAHEI